MTRYKGDRYGVKLIWELTTNFADRRVTYSIKDFFGNKTETNKTKAAIKPENPNQTEVIGKMDEINK